MVTMTMNRTDHDGRHADDAHVPTSCPQVDKFFTATATIRANASLDGLDKCGAVPKDSMHLLRSAKPGESDLPWYVTLCSCIPISPSPGPGWLLALPSPQYGTGVLIRWIQQLQMKVEVLGKIELITRVRITDEFNVDERWSSKELLLLETCPTPRVLVFLLVGSRFI